MSYELKSESDDLNILSEYCQCCLSVDNLKNINIQSDQVDSYSNLLLDCFSIQIFDDYALEEQCYICSLCIKKLNESYLFRRTILESQNKIKNLFKEKDLLSISPLPEEYFDTNNSFFKTEYLDEDLEDNNSIPLQIHNYLEENDGVTNVEYLKDDDYIQSEDKILQQKSKNVSNTPKNNSGYNSVVKKIKIITKRPDKNNPQNFDSFPKDAFTSAIENLLNSNENNDSGQERVRNNFKDLSKEELINYKRLYNRYRYAKAIPFKLDETALNCEICKESFSTHKFLVSHMAVHYANYICDLCGKSFVLRSHLVGHLKRHSLDKISCSVCNKLLKKTSLTRHMKTHSGDNCVYACPYCNDRFTSFSMRVNHLAQKHDVDIYKYACKICSKKFYLAGCLSKHVRRCHFQELNATCEECGKGFFDKKSLKEHMLKHSREKKFQCKICLKSYARKHTIKEHMKIHEKA